MCRVCCYYYVHDTRSKLPCTQVVGLGFVLGNFHYLLIPTQRVALICLKPKTAHSTWGSYKTMMHQWSMIQQSGYPSEPPTKRLFVLWSQFMTKRNDHRHNNNRIRITTSLRLKPIAPGHECESIQHHYNSSIASFSNIFDSRQSQLQCYSNACSTTVDEFLSGQNNCTIFVYGQTGKWSSFYNFELSCRLHRG